MDGAVVVTTRSVCGVSVRAPVVHYYTTQVPDNWTDLTQRLSNTARSSCLDLSFEFPPLTEEPSAREDTLPQSRPLTYEVDEAKPFTLKRRGKQCLSPTLLLVLNFLAGEVFSIVLIFSPENHHRLLTNMVADASRTGTHLQLTRKGGDRTTLSEIQIQPPANKKYAFRPSSLDRRRRCEEFFFHPRVSTLAKRLQLCQDTQTGRGKLSP